MDWNSIEQSESAPIVVGVLLRMQEAEEATV